MRVTLTNDGPSNVWVGRQLDVSNADWIVDGLDRDARQRAAAASLQPPLEMSFSGPTGDSFPRDLVVALGPHRSRAMVLDVVQSQQGSKLVANGVDISSMTLLADALVVPGSHVLGLLVHSYPKDGMVGPGWEYETPWETRCNTVQIEVRP